MRLRWRIAKSALHFGAMRAILSAEGGRMMAGQKPADRRRAIIRRLRALLRGAALKPPPVVEKRRPAAALPFHEGLNPRRGAVIGRVGQNLSDKPRARVLLLGDEHRRPVHPRRLELLGAHVVPKRRLAHAVEVRGEPRVDLRVVEPRPSPLMHLSGRWLKKQ